MTEEEKSNNVQISIEQICAAMLSTLGTVEVPLENLIKNYSDKSIAVNQDQDTKSVTFTLADNPIENIKETVQESE